MNRDFEERKTRGHGCCGFFLVLVLVVGGIIALLAFSTNFLDVYKNKVYAFFYPQKYADYVEQYSAQYGVSSSLVYAVMRTESGFREEVESSAGAIGLMQIMPSTFEWLQNAKDGEVTMTSSSLFDPQVNIEYGTYLLSYLRDRYEDENTAVAAYNAGMTNVDAWLSDSRYSSDGSALSAIPFSETEQYVERVEKTKVMYEKIYE